MELTISKENLSPALEAAALAAAGKSATLPVLLHVRLSADAEAGTLRLRATDLSTFLDATVPAQVAEGDDLTVDCARLAQFVGETDGPFALETKRRKLTVSSGKHTSTFKTGVLDDYPTLPTADAGTPLFRADADAVLASVAGVTFARGGKNEPRTALTCVLLRAVGDTLTTAAADGYRMATAEADGAGTDDAGLLLAADKPERLLSRLEGEVAASLAADGRFVVFDDGDLRVGFVTAEAKFPDFEAIVPRDAPVSLRFDRAALLDAVKTCARFTDPKTGSVTLATGPAPLDTDGATLVTVSGGGQGGSAKIEVAAVPTRGAGEAVTVELSHRYLSQSLTALRPAKRVDMELSGPSLPVVLRPADAEKPLHVIMPMGD